jgi:hypothetical protein
MKKGGDEDVRPEQPRGVYVMSWAMDAFHPWQPGETPVRKQPIVWVGKDGTEMVVKEFD